MLNSSELNYIIALIKVYSAKGYPYYLCLTHDGGTTNSNDYDIELYFSAEPIVAITDDNFRINNGIKIIIDSDSKREF